MSIFNHLKRPGEDVVADVTAEAPRRFSRVGTGAKVYDSGSSESPMSLTDWMRREAKRPVEASSAETEDDQVVLVPFEHRPITDESDAESVAGLHRIHEEKENIEELCRMWRVPGLIMRLMTERAHANSVQATRDGVTWRYWYLPQFRFFHMFQPAHLAIGVRIVGDDDSPPLRVLAFLSPDPYELVVPAVETFMDGRRAKVPWTLRSLWLQSLFIRVVVRYWEDRHRAIMAGVLTAVSSTRRKLVANLSTKVNPTDVS